ncbi:hypothetical protein [Streptomyces sp. Tue 6075]|uniref:hypothetical protein n=1 Tax=Streptomyces sp. Tue 6075 TaxID=1661694 RepID=UPI00094AC759|nr:hypothetical protein [Streptomyces sp. Tue 6075]
MSIGVIGEGLRVHEVRVLLDGRKPGARARISEWRSGTYVREIRDWKHMTYKELALHPGPVAGPGYR